MAKVLNPLNSTEARGRVGGLVYNTWRGIRYVKTHTQPGHQSDPKRQAHKLIVQEAGLRWQTLSDAQRAAWTHYANTHTDIDWTGSPKRIAGYHWYVRIQTRRQDVGEGYDDTPPSITCRWKHSGLAAGWWVDHIDLYWDLLDPSSPFQLYTDIWLAGPHSAGRNPTIHDATRNAIQNQDEREYYIYDLTQGWYTIFVRIICANGITAPWLSLRCEVPAP
jgi:hypothetical protein